MSLTVNEKYLAYVTGQVRLIAAALNTMAQGRTAMPRSKHETAPGPRCQPDPADGTQHARSRSTTSPPATSPAWPLSGLASAGPASERHSGTGIKNRRTAYAVDAALAMYPLNGKFRRPVFEGRTWLGTLQGRIEPDESSFW